MPHTHTYDKNGKQLCCTQEEKIYAKAGASELLKDQPSDPTDYDHGKKKVDSHVGYSDDDGHNHGQKKPDSPKDEGCCSHGDADDSRAKEGDHSDDDGHDHSSGNQSVFQMFLPAIISLALLLIAIALDNYVKADWFSGWVRVVWYVVA